MKTLELRDDGGQAFPCGYHPEGNSADQGGMTLRDYFAANEHLSDYDKDILYISKDVAIDLVGREMPMVRTVDYFVWDAEVRAALKYIRADAMIRERNKVWVERGAK